MDQEKLDSNLYNFITILIGVNNQYQGIPFSKYELEYNELIDRAIALLGGDSDHLIVVSIPDYSVTPFASASDTDRIATEIKRYNDYKKEITEAKGARFVYITDLTQNAKEDASLLANDGLHPSGKSYSQWVERIIPELNKIVNGL